MSERNDDMPISNVVLLANPHPRTVGPTSSMITTLRIHSSTGKLSQSTE